MLKMGVWSAALVLKTNSVKTVATTNTKARSANNFFLPFIVNLQNIT
jgi:hypothetical protein